VLDASPADEPRDLDIALTSNPGGARRLALTDFFATLSLGLGRFFGSR
jgi:hypothetical protein